MFGIVFHSTKTARVRVHNDIMVTVDNNNSVILLRLVIGLPGCSFCIVKLPRVVYYWHRFIEANSGACGQSPPAELHC